MHLRWVLAMLCVLALAGCDDGGEDPGDVTSPDTSGDGDATADASPDGSETDAAGDTGAPHDAVGDGGQTVPGIDCRFEPVQYDGFPVDDTPIQLVSADGAACVRIAREVVLPDDGGFFVCKACEYRILEASVGHDGATRHVTDAAAFEHEATHHNWNDTYRVRTAEGVYEVVKAYRFDDQTNEDTFSHVLTGYDPVDGTTVVLGPIELVPYVP